MWKKFIMGVGRFFKDVFTDIRGAFDEKRFWGNILMGLGVYVVIASIGRFDQYTWITAGGLFTFGILVLGIAARADGKIGELNVPDPSAILTKIENVVATFKGQTSTVSVPPDSGGPQ